MAWGEGEALEGAAPWAEDLPTKVGEAIVGVALVGVVVVGTVQTDWDEGEVLGG